MHDTAEVYPQNFRCVVQEHARNYSSLLPVLSLSVHVDEILIPDRSLHCDCGCCLSRCTQDVFITLSIHRKKKVRRQAGQHHPSDPKYIYYECLTEGTCNNGKEEICKSWIDRARDYVVESRTDDL
jgi:hypothetical protein